MNAIPYNLQHLSVAERIQLAEDLWDSIGDGNDPALRLTAEQTAELGRRLAAHKADPTSALSWEEVRASLFPLGG